MTEKDNKKAAWVANHWVVKAKMLEVTRLREELARCKGEVDGLRDAYINEATELLGVRRGQAGIPTRGALSQVIKAECPSWKLCHKCRVRIRELPDEIAVLEKQLPAIEAEVADTYELSKELEPAADLLIESKQDILLKLDDLLKALKLGEERQQDYAQIRRALGEYIVDEYEVFARAQPWQRLDDVENWTGSLRAALLDGDSVSEYEAERLETRQRDKSEKNLEQRINEANTQLRSTPEGEAMLKQADQIRRTAKNLKIQDAENDAFYDPDETDSPEQQHDKKIKAMLLQAKDIELQFEKQAAQQGGFLDEYIKVYPTGRFN